MFASSNKREKRERNDTRARPGQHDAPREAADADEATRDGAYRHVCTGFKFWRVCRKACQRAKGCAGDDAEACFRRFWPHVCERDKVMFRAAIKARVAGHSVEDAMRISEQEVVRAAEHIARVEAKRDARLDALEAAERAQRGDAAMPAREPPLPRVRVL